MSNKQEVVDELIKSCPYSSIEYVENLMLDKVYKSINDKLTDFNNLKTILSIQKESLDSMHTKFIQCVSIRNLSLLLNYWIQKSECTESNIIKLKETVEQRKKENEQEKSVFTKLFSKDKIKAEGQKIENDIMSRCMKIETDKKLLDEVSGMVYQSNGTEIKRYNLTKLIEENKENEEKVKELQKQLEELKIPKQTKKVDIFKLFTERLNEMIKGIDNSTDYMRVFFYFAYVASGYEVDENYQTFVGKVTNFKETCLTRVFKKIDNLNTIASKEIDIQQIKNALKIIVNMIFYSDDHSKLYQESLEYIIYLQNSFKNKLKMVYPKNDYISLPFCEILKLNIYYNFYMESFEKCNELLELVKQSKINYNLFSLAKYLGTKKFVLIYNEIPFYDMESNEKYERFLKDKVSIDSVETMKTLVKILSKTIDNIDFLTGSTQLVNNKLEANKLRGSAIQLRKAGLDVNFFNNIDSKAESFKQNITKLFSKYSINSKDIGISEILLMKNIRKYLRIIESLQNNNTNEYDISLHNYFLE